MKLKGAIFDLDGVLLDSMPFWDNLGAEYLKLKGYAPPDNLNEILKTMSLAQSASYFKEQYGIPKNTDEIIKEIIRLIESQYRLEVPLKPFVARFLDMLYEKNIKMCVATATDYDLAKAALKRLGVDHYFEFILTCSQAGTGKDNPEFFLKVLELLGTPKSETMVFEDALHAIKSAKKAGLIVTGVYDQSAVEDLEEIKATADVYINTFEEWKMII